MTIDEYNPNKVIKDEKFLVTCVLKKYSPFLDKIVAVSLYGFIIN